jgi:hypothetical protein
MAVGNLKRSAEYADLNDMRRTPKTGYLLLWRKANGKTDKHWYVQRSAVGKRIKKLSSQSCRDVHVVAGELKDVSDEFLADHYDAAAVDRREIWAKKREFRIMLLMDNPGVANWLMRQKHADGVLTSIEPPINRWLRFTKRRPGRRK